MNHLTLWFTLTSTEIWSEALGIQGSHVSPTVNLSGSIVLYALDAEYYRNMTRDQPTYTSHRTFAKPSRVVLPVVKR